MYFFLYYFFFYHSHLYRRMNMTDHLGRKQYSFALQCATHHENMKRKLSFLTLKNINHLLFLSLAAHFIFFSKSLPHVKNETVYFLLCNYRL